jgi:hypothetical protein
MTYARREAQFEVGMCGEHGGDPKTWPAVQARLNYGAVAHRVPDRAVDAAQAALRTEAEQYALVVCKTKTPVFSSHDSRINDGINQLIMKSVTCPIY